MGIIGKRAAEAIRQMANHNETSYEFELDCLKVSRETLYQWEHGKSDPRASALANMALAGYDTHYILTGESNDNRDAGG